MASSKDDILKQVGSLREKLLDMSRNNRLLNFRPTKKSIKIVDEDIAELFQILVLDSNIMEFLPKQNLSDDDLDLTPEEIESNVWKMPKSDNEILDSHRDLFLQTDIVEEKLQKILLNVFYDYKTNIEEQGYNSLFLALGFLEWYEDDNSDKVNKAPLILIPVEISRKSVGSPFTIRWTFDDIRYNLSLQYKLLEQGINIPDFNEFESKGEVYDYLNRVKSEISSKSGWIVSNEIFISNFQFKKSVMFQDLNMDKWSDNVLANHVNELFNSEEVEYDDVFDEDCVDELLDSRDVFHVLDADSSQIAVIEEVKKNRNLVVEGPPGTGKSQTIVNLIAELIANGKKVLFVSEKMAALEVVKNRLDTIGLGDYCLELHSNKSNKKAVLEEFNRVLSKNKSNYSYKDYFSKLEKVKHELNDYIEIINSKFYDSGYSVYDLIGLREFKQLQLEKLNQEIIYVDFNNIENLTHENISETVDNLTEVKNLYELIYPLGDNPWSVISKDYVLPQDLDLVEKNINEFYNQLISIKNSLNNISKIAGVSKSVNISDIEKLEKNHYLLEREYKVIEDDLAELVSNIEKYQNKTKKINQEFLKLDLEDIKSQIADLEDKISNLSIDSRILKNENVDELISNLKEYMDYISNSNLELALKDNELSNKFNLFKSKKDSFTRHFSGEYKQIKNEFKSYYSNDVEDEEIIGDLEKLIDVDNKLNKLHLKFTSYCDGDLSNDKIIVECEKLTELNDSLGDIKDNLSKYCPEFKNKSLNVLIDELIKIKQLNEWITSKSTMAIKYFKDIWDGVNTNLVDLKNYYNDLLKFNRLYDSGFFSKTTLEFYKNNKFSSINDDCDKVITAKESFKNIYSKLNDILDFKSDILNNDFEYLTDLFNSFIKNFNKLSSYLLFMRKSKEYSNEFISSLLDLIETDKLTPEAIIPTFEFNYSNNALNKLIMDEPILRDFNADLFDKNVCSFKQLDEATLKLNRCRIRQNLDKKLPSITGSINLNSELGILTKELGKKRRIKPIRTLLNECRNVIGDIKPCFMMSPISIAQYLTPEVYEYYFDYVIFDEASQVRTEDAIGALLRGKNYVIMGDSKQLPPTKFFDKEYSDDESDDVLEIESILELCKVSFPYKSLKWHYRSRHDSLISVSNMEFYNNELYVFPSPKINTSDFGLKFEYNPQNLYDKGKSSQNRGEAKDIVEYAVKHFEKYGHSKSLGIGTFSKNQQRAILEELEIKLKQRPEYDEYFSSKGEDGFFVKNLENIQGDERDVILISVGYGFDLNKKLSKNFGPLNKNGGEKRLNVLITRAREKCVVFSNFRSNDLGVDYTSKPCVKALNNFLYYAEYQKFPSTYSTGEDFDSDFEKSVYEFLIEKGYAVEKQVGSAGYKIDLAIIDEVDKNNYVLGIECDGAPYHSSRVARDRDRLRQQILEGLGWSFYRIWSTDWYHNRKHAQEKLLNAIEDAKSYKKTEIIDEFEPEIEVSLIIEEDGLAIDDYEKYTTTVGLEFYDTPISTLSNIVDDIIDYEHPIHTEEIYNRIKEIYGIKLTKKAKTTIDEALNSKNRKTKGEFYYKSFNEDIKLKRRENPSIDYICDDEIKKSIREVLKQQYSLDGDNLAKEASLLLGFKSLRKNVKERFIKIIDDMGDELVYSNDSYSLK